MTSPQQHSILPTTYHRVPEELWTEVHNIVQEVAIKTIRQEKEMQKGKMVVWGGLTNSWEKKRNERKGERGRYAQMNAAFQRIARRDKKAFLRDHSEEIEENNEMMLWKRCTQYASKFGKLSSGHRTGKGQFSLQSLRKATSKNVQTTTQLHSSHTLAK